MESEQYKKLHSLEQSDLFKTLNKKFDSSDKFEVLADPSNNTICLVYDDCYVCWFNTDTKQFDIDLEYDFHIDEKVEVMQAIMTFYFTCYNDICNKD